MTAQNLFGNLALDQSVQDLKALTDQLNALNDTMLYFLPAMLDKMPRISRSDQTVVDMGESGLTNSAASQIINANGNPATNTVYFRTHEQYHFANVGAFHLYNSILVS